MRHDSRLDSQDTVIGRAGGDDDDRLRLDSWILDSEIQWERVDRVYWKGVFTDAIGETFVPGEGVFSSRWNGEPQKERDELGMFWKRLVWSRELPLGEDPDPWAFGRGPDGPGRYGAPRTHVRWIRALRFMVRIEAALLKAGTRRTLDDYSLLARNGLKIAINLMVADLDCVDNIRFAETGKPGEMRRYNRAKNSGCCGSVDRYVIIGFKQYVVGCNHGH